MNQSYATPLAFKQALEQQLRNQAENSARLSRVRQLLVFDRYLARISEVLGDAVVLKGGLVLELRLGRARTTKDIDLRLTGATDSVLESLQAAARLDLGDFLSFEVAADATHPVMTGDGMKYDGMRFQCDCRLAGKIYGQRFGIDVGMGDPIFGSPSRVTLDDTLDFAGIPPATLQLYPVVTHIAEKLHAYTMPRDRPNSRVKDLPDIALLAGTGPLVATELRAAAEQTFSFRDTHAIPSSVPKPPSTWERPYAAIARNDDLVWRDLDDLARAVSAFLDPALSSEDKGLRWNPSSWTWFSE